MPPKLLHVRNAPLLQRSDSQEKLVVVINDRVVRPWSGDRSFRQVTFCCVWNEKLPLVGRVLQGIQIEGNEIVVERPLDLSAKDIDLGSKDIECMPISSTGFGAGRRGS